MSLTPDPSPSPSDVKLYEVRLAKERRLIGNATTFFHHSIIPYLSPSIAV